MAGGVRRGGRGRDGEDVEEESECEKRKEKK